MKKKVPLMKNCRVDYHYMSGSNWSILVDYINNNTLYVTAGTYQLKELYGSFKFSVLNELPIDNFPYIPLSNPFYKIESAKYYY